MPGGEGGDVYVEDALTPISSRGGVSPRQPAPKRLQARRAHNNFVPSAAAGPSPAGGAPLMAPTRGTWVGDGAMKEGESWRC